MISKTLRAILRFFELDKKSTLSKVIVFLFFLMAILFFFMIQERRKTAILNSCSFYTIMEPRNMSSYNYMNYDFYYNDSRFSSSSTVSALDLGYSYAPDIAMSRRYLIQVNCENFETHRILWKIPVPDTLKYIPPKGWKKIPYGLQEESAWFKRWRK